MKYTMSLIFLLLLIAAGCQRYGVIARRQTVDPTYLASTHIGSPDPRQEDPPHGQMVIVEWWVPQELFTKNPKICLHIIFWDYTERRIEFPINRRVGYETYFILGDDYCTTEGILTYKAEIITDDGCVFRDWKHQLWVNLIQMEEEQVPECIESNSSSVSDQSIQGSVMEIPSSM